MVTSRDYSRNRRSRAGFTLIEALIALVMFGLITMSLAMALSAAMKAQQVSARKQDDAGTARAVFGTMTRDIEAAYGSMNSPASVFITGGASGGGGGGSTIQTSPGLLLFSTLSHRIQDGRDMSQGPVGGMPTAAQSALSSDTPPQSDMALVRYNLDSATGMLTRTAISVPYAQDLDQQTPGPAVTLAQHVVSLTFRYWDFNQQNWRDSWDYEQQNQQGVTPTSAGTSSATPASGATGSSASSQANQSTTGDATLPGAVEVTLVVMRENGTTANYMTTIPIVAPQPYVDPNTQAQNNGTAPASTTTSGSRTPSGG